jgi:MYXO-CTERM domain-containing protein
MTLSRLLSAFGVLSAAVVTACGAGSPPETEVGSVAQAVSIPKSYTRKIYVHMMPWFTVGGQHWSMNSRNSATTIASWYHPLIGEYSSNDGNVIEYQLLTMKFAGIDGVIIDWPGLSGAFDLPQNKANADAIIGRTAAFGLQFGIVYEDNDAGSVGAAQSDMAYVRDNFFNKSNYIQVDSKPALMVFGPSRYHNAGDWTTILSVFPTKPMFFPIWYNTDVPTADGRFAWLSQNALKGVSDFDMVLDGVDQGIRIPVFYPGFNPYYQAGGWPGPTYKISYTLKQDNTEGGNTFQSGFALGQYAGPFLQIATWNDYGEGTMIEPTDQFQYQPLTTLQQAVGTKYTDAELKIVKLLFDKRRQTNGSMAAQLDQASAALANLDFATACGILGCTVPVHTGGGSGGATGAGGSPGAGGMPAAGGSFTAGGSPGAGGSPTGSAGHTSTGTGGTGIGAGGTGTAAGGTGTPGGTAAAAATDGGDTGSSSSCSVSAAGANRTQPFALLFAASALGFVASRRRKR